MHKDAIGHTREEIVRQSMKREKFVKDYASYVPVGNVAKKIKHWVDQGAEIIYMTSRRKKKEIDAIQSVLQQNHFPEGLLEHRRLFEKYKDVAERIMPDILIEDDCESIGGEKEMTYPHIKPEVRTKIKSIVVREFEGIDRLPDNIELFRVSSRIQCTMSSVL